MEFFRIIYRNVLRHPLRSFLTALGMAIALCAFALIRTLIGAWYAGVEASAKDRLVVRNSVSLVFYLPAAYGPTIQGVPGVRNVGYGNWFGGIFKDERFRFQQFAIDNNYLDIYPEFLLPAAHRRNWEANRRGILVGKQLAESFSIAQGDVIQIKGTIFPGLWEFQVEGIIQGRDEATDTRLMLFHWQYLNERNKAEIGREPDNVGFYVVQLEPGSNPAEVSKAIDSRFANSFAETLSETETAFIQGFVSMSSTIILTLQVVSGVVIVIMLLVMANTMLMSFRERYHEYSVLKSLGFTPRDLSVLIFGEALALAGLGLVITTAFLAPIALIPTRTLLGDLVNFFPVFKISASTVALTLLYALIVSVLASLLPLRSMARLKIVDGLRNLS